MMDLIVSRGRVADRAERLIAGAELTARAIELRYGVPSTGVGEPGAATVEDDWTVSLPQAKQTLVELADAIGAGVSRGGLTVLAANTCSASLASLPVVARAHPDAVVLWVDAHGDFNTPATTGSGYLGGMALSGACGLWDSGHGAGLEPEQVVLVGARDIDPAERELLRESGVRIIPPGKATAANVLAAVRGAPVWIHIDWDVLEPGFIPADYEVAGGLLPSAVRALIEALPPESILGVELAEFNAPENREESELAVAAILDVVGPALDAATA